jgi:pimeloyl-ACP methyl ester carboxylesterase
MSRTTRTILLTLLPLIALGAVGCAAQPQNASFSITNDGAEKLLAEMRSHPKQLQRPLIILGGFNDPGFAASHLRNQFRGLTKDDRVIGVSFLFCGDFDDCKKAVIDAVDGAFPNTNLRFTTEVDVIGVSMGGLVARYAAAADPKHPDARRLRIARLFTISSPHRGAMLATLPTFSRLQLDMRSDSKFLSQLGECESCAAEDTPKQYKLVPYVRLGDEIVGEQNAAPYGQTPHWVPGEPLQNSHIGAMLDARIIADVARRLRGEKPLTTDPPAPLPT